MRFSCSWWYISNAIHGYWNDVLLQNLAYICVRQDLNVKGVCFILSLYKVINATEKWTIKEWRDGGIYKSFKSLMCMSSQVRWLHREINCLPNSPFPCSSLSIFDMMEEMYIKLGVLERLLLEVLVWALTEGLIGHPRLYHWDLRRFDKHEMISSSF